MIPEEFFSFCKGFFTDKRVVINLFGDICLVKIHVASISKFEGASAIVFSAITYISIVGCIAYSIWICCREQR
jgi:hypothetical protein